MSGRDRRAAWVLAVALLFSYAYFYEAGGWNQNSRFALVRAILERHTLQIDAYAAHTGDRARYNDHYYSDKAPGASLLAVPFVAMARGIDRLVGVDPEDFPGIAWTSYVATVVTCGLFTMIAALVIYRLSLAWGYSRGAALFAATGYALATPAWAYAVLFMGHGLTVGCLMLAFAAAVDLARVPPEQRGRAAWIVGAAGGWAVVSEFPAAVPLLIVLALAAMSVYEARADWRPVVWRVIVGGGCTALVLGAYNAAAFGSPFHLGYASEEGFEKLRTGLFGITYPAWWRLRELLVGGYRGLLPLAPLVAVMPVGLFLLWRTRATRRPAVAAALIAAFYLLLNASYFYWEGGWAYGPRQMMPGLAFAALGLAPLWDRRRTAVRVLLAAGWIWGASLSLMAVSTTPQPPGDLYSPVRELLWPAFKAGDLSLNNQSMVHMRGDEGRLLGGRTTHYAWNLGEIAGLHGLPSLVPLLVVWIIAAVVLLL